MNKANIFILVLVIWASGFMSNSSASSILDKIDGLDFTSVSFDSDNKKLLSGLLNNASNQGVKNEYK